MVTDDDISFEEGMTISLGEVTMRDYLIYLYDANSDYESDGAADEVPVTFASSDDTFVTAADVSVASLETDLYDAVSAEEGTVTPPAAYEVSASLLTIDFNDPDLDEKNESRLDNRGADDEPSDGATDEAAVTSASTHEASTTALLTDLHNIVSADEDLDTMPTADEASATPAEADPDEGGPADLHAVMDSHGVLATCSTNSQRKTLRRVRKFFSRMFRALCCCCSEPVE